MHLIVIPGQAIAANTALFPAPFQTRFSKLFDEAPQVPYADIERVFLSEFGKPPAGEGGVFEEFEMQAVASASIAQVHRARLKRRLDINGNPEESGGAWVAVKIQKPAVSKQVEWDLAAYKALGWMYERWVIARSPRGNLFININSRWIFHLPIYFLVGQLGNSFFTRLTFTLGFQTSYPPICGLNSTFCARRVMQKRQLL